MPLELGNWETIFAIFWKVKNSRIGLFSISRIRTNNLFKLFQNETSIPQKRDSFSIFLEVTVFHSFLLCDEGPPLPSLDVRMTCKSEDFLVTTGKNGDKKFDSKNEHFNWIKLLQIYNSFYHDECPCIFFSVLICQFITSC